MFCEVQGLRPQATVQGVMCVVECMNTVFSCFDSLTDRFNVYKVNNNFQKSCNSKITYWLLLLNCISFMSIESPN